MPVVYEFIDSRGILHEITESHLEDSFRTLTLAGFDMHKAHEISLEYLVAKLQLNSIPLEDLLYRTHDFETEDSLCSLVATRLAQRQINL